MFTITAFLHMNSVQMKQEILTASTKHKAMRLARRMLTRYDVEKRVVRVECDGAVIFQGVAVHEDWGGDLDVHFDDGREAKARGLH